jgi:hypothetical protein
MRSMAHSHKDRDVLTSDADTDIDMRGLPTGPNKTEKQMMQAALAWAN